MDIVKKWVRIYACVCVGTLGRMSGPLSVMSLAVGVFFEASDAHKQAKLLFYALAYISMLVFAISTAMKNYQLTIRASNRAAMLNELGTLHIALSKRAAKIKAEGFSRYVPPEPIGYDGTADAETSAILGKIEFFLKLHFTTSEAALLISKTGFQPTALSPQSIATPRYATWRLMLDHIDDYSQRLEQIIKSKQSNEI